MKKLISLLALLAVPTFAAPPPAGKEPAPAAKPAETAKPMEKTDKATPTEEKQEAVNIPAEDKRGPADAGAPPPKANKKKK